MTNNQLKVFCTVVEMNSFSRASAALQVSQPAVSMHVKSLEQELGTTLIERTNGDYTRLTKAGALIFEKANQILSNIAVMQEIAQRERQVFSPDLKVGASPSLGTYLVPDIVANFKNRHPGCRILIQTSSSKDILPQMENLDFGLLILNSTSGLEVDFVHREEMALIVAPTHHLQSFTQPFPLDRLPEIPLILPPRTSLARQFVEAFLNRLGITPNIILEISYAEAIKRAVQSGIGGALICHSTIMSELANGTIHQVQLREKEKIYIPFYLVHKKKQPLNPLQADFAAFLHEALN